MSHGRLQIRNAFRTALLSSTDAGTNIFLMRTFPVQASLTRAILIYTTNESSSLATVGSLGAAQSYRRDLMVNVDGYVKANASIEDDLDQLALQIEEAIESDTALRALVEEYQLTSTEMQTEENETAVGMVRLSYNVVYRTRPESPDVIIP